MVLVYTHKKTYATPIPTFPLFSRLCGLFYTPAKIFLKKYKKKLAFFSKICIIIFVPRMRHKKLNKVSAISSVGRAPDS